MTDVRVTHPEKVLFPDDGYTKADVVGYYLDVAPAMLAHMRDHPLAMLRFNDGIHGERFFHKNTPDYFPDYIDRVDMQTSKRITKLAVVNNAKALGYIANHNCIEFHVMPVRADDLSHPDRLVFDLDPSTENFDEIREAARFTRGLLDEVGLPSYLMTSGSRGLHIWVPLNRKASTDEVLAFLGLAAALLAARHPDLLTTEFTKVERGDKIYVDVGRNKPAQHAVTPYSLRAKPGAPIATPIDWAELDDPALHPQRYTIADRRGGDDPWAGMKRAARALGPAMKKLQRLAAA